MFAGIFGNLFGEAWQHEALKLLEENRELRLKINILEADNANLRNKNFGLGATIHRERVFGHERSRQ